MILEYSSHQIPIGPASEKLAVELRAQALVAATKNDVYTSPKESIRLVRDTTMLDNTLTMVDQMNTDALKFVFLVGIGGSSLGTEAVIQALPKTGTDKYPEIIILDTIDAARLAFVSALITASITSADDFCVTLISKSGGTTESLVNFAALVEMLRHVEGWEKRVVVITDDGSKLMEKATAEGYRTLAIPSVIGGRFSIFTPVGVFPLALAGYDVQGIFKGAEQLLSLLGTINDPTLHLAEDIDRGQRAGMRTLDFFLFDPSLEGLGKWSRQLWAESLGKGSDREGYPIHTGLLPTVSMGTEDLHSMLQFYFGGPRDRMTIFVPPPATVSEKIKPHPFNEFVPGIEGKTAHELLTAIYSGVRSAYREHGLATMEVSSADERAVFLGAFMQWQMCAVIALGEAWNINAFDQPNVEDYKKFTRDLLAGQK